MRVLFYSIIARIINIFVQVRKDEWVFASDFGNLYREGSKYLFEYMCKNHPEIHSTYIVRNPDTYREIKSKGYPVAMNYSFKGILIISRAKCVFTTQSCTDIHFAYKKNSRLFFYLNHGQSLKKQMKALPSNLKKNKGKENYLTKIVLSIKKWFILGYNMDDVSFVSANSEFFIPFLKCSYGDEMPIKVLGMPRNDALFLHDEMKIERWMDNLEGKFVITYMPTHRKYGKGDLSPVPFENRPDIQKWLKDNRVVILMKQHPNMISKLKDTKSSDVVIDITKSGYDPQVVIYHSDVLISDYSSVWLDYLLLNRPLITYLYDDFEDSDAGVNFDARKDTPGHLCTNEDELFVVIKKIMQDYDGMKPSAEAIHKFYKDPDGNACKRYFEAVMSLY